MYSVKRPQEQLKRNKNHRNFNLNKLGSFHLYQIVDSKSDFKERRYSRKIYTYCNLKCPLRYELKSRKKEEYDYKYGKYH